MSLDSINEQARWAFEAFDSSTDHVAILDRAGTILAVNAGWRRFAEDNGASAATVGPGQNYLEVCRKAGTPTALQAIRAIEDVALASRPGAKVEYPCHAPSIPRWFRLDVRPMPTAGLLIVHRDISTEHQVRQRLDVLIGVAQLLDQHERLDGLAERLLEVVAGAVDADAGALWTIEPERDELRCSSFWLGRQPLAAFELATRARRLSRSAGLPGRVWASATPGWIRAPSWDDSSPPAAELDGVQAAFAFPVISARGVLAVCELYSREVFEPDHELLATLGAVGRQVGQVVTRERAERRFEMLFDAVPDGLLVTDPAGRIEQVNRTATTMFGYEREELLGQPIETLVPEAHTRQHDSFLRAATRQSIGRIDLHGVRKDGSLVPVDLNLAPFVEGATTSILAAVRDVGWRQRLERELAQARRLEAVNRLASGIAHEINTPLQILDDNVHFLGAAITALAGSVEQTLAERPRRLQHAITEAPRAIASCKTAIERVAELVTAMKLFAPVEDQRDTFDLHAAIATTIITSRSAWSSVAHLTTELAADLPPVSGFSSSLSQALLHLIVNAAHAIAELGGHEGTITIRTRMERDWIAIEVADTGIGIPERVREHIFEPFFTTKPVGAGRGQGLTIVRSVVDRHAGTIDFTTVERQGTTFVVRIPRTS
jgi:PAS domain S-box-containing protein